MLKKQRNVGTILTIFLTMIWIQGCNSLINKNVTDENFNLCTSTIQPFELTEKEKQVLRREVKENMLDVNCSLYKECNIKLPNPSSCDF